MSKNKETQLKLHRYRLALFSCKPCGRTIAIKRFIEVPDDMTYMHLGCNRCKRSTYVELTSVETGHRWDNIFCISPHCEIQYKLVYA